MLRSPRALILFLILVFTTTATAAEPHHDLVRVPLTTPGAVEFLRAHTGDLDIVFVKPGVEAHVAARPGDIAALQAAGLAPEIMQRDMERANQYPDKGAGFGVYHTYSENVAFMDSLRVRFPDLVSEKWSIGTTYEGRDIWAYRVSDNPDVDENEPEILIDGMHHGREIMASEFPIMFAEYLAMNYGTDPEITWLVDNRELYLIPIVNPDCIVYNETTNPNGGGMWRKNRRPVGVDIGVDLNRNYPNHWGFDDIGSSPTPSSITYRGPSAASELETQAMLNFVNGREIITHDTVHTYSNLTLYPWGYVATPTPHDAIFVRMGQEMTKFNGYTAGQPGAIPSLYAVNGGTIDTFYGDTAGHPAIFSVSNEIGTSSDGFWPPESRRGALFQENIWPHIYLMRAAGAFVAAHTAVATTTAKVVNPGDNGALSFTIENQSVAVSSLGVSVTVRTDDPWIQLLGAERTVGAIPAQGSVTLAGNPIPFAVDAACPAGHQVLLTATVHMGDGDLDFPLSFIVGTAPVMLSDNLEGGVGNWTLSGAWGQTASTSHSPTRSLTDSPVGAYGNNSATSATLNGNWRASKLRFWHKYATEANYDYATVQVSANGGAWATLATYHGTLSTWTQVSLDLGAHAGQDLAVRFLLTSDESIFYDGWYIDDVELDGDPTSAFAMTPPFAFSPTGGLTVGVAPVLTVLNSPVPGGFPGFYGFRVYRDALCTDLVASVDNIAESPIRTEWIVPALADGAYWWRAWAGDGADRTALCAPEWFTVRNMSAVDVGLDLGLRVLGAAGGNGARLELTLPAHAEVTLDIHDARGARIRRIFSGSLEAGSRVLSWDGRDGQGRAAASGMYFARAQVGGRHLVGRVVVVR